MLGLKPGQDLGHTSPADLKMASQSCTAFDNAAVEQGLIEVSQPERVSLGLYGR